MKPSVIIKLNEALKANKITSETLVKRAINQTKKYHDCNPLVTPTFATALSAAHQQKVKTASPLLAGIPTAIKDNFTTKTTKTTACSNILTNFYPHYDAAAVEILNQNEAISIGKATLDELALGGDGLYANTGHVLNPWAKDRIIGGSSSGSAVLVAIGAIPYALGTDTGDSIRKPASYAGVVGFKPSYGLISRYGLIPYAPSLDTVGFLTTTVADCALLLDLFAKKDHRDYTNVVSPEKNWYQNLDPNLTGKRLVYLQSVVDDLAPTTKTLFFATIKKLETAGAKVSAVDFDLKLLQALLPTYMVISFAEATSCHSCLDGINFGVRKPGTNYQEIMINSRTAGFGAMAKRRYVIGSYVLKQENQARLFIKAKKIRRLIANELVKVLSQADGLINPATADVPPTIKAVLDHRPTTADMAHIADNILLLANFASAPSITIPMGTVKNLPIGLNITTLPFRDQLALDLAAGIETVISDSHEHSELGVYHV